MLIAALNPCPCGFRGDPRRKCTCHPQQVEKYMARISGPLVDRIDIHIEVPAVPFQELTSKTEGTSSQTIRENVVAARDLQTQRFAHRRTRQNAQMSSREIREYCQLDEPCQEVMKNSVHELGLSARAHDKVLRVARTIADLEKATNIEVQHLMEAVNYRLLDRQS
jgi:magnesium chelatase family protein